MTNDDGLIRMSKSDAFLLALSMYLGEPCYYCGLIFETLDSLKDAVRADAPDFTLAHRTCYEAATSASSGTDTTRTNEKEDS